MIGAISNSLYLKPSYGYGMNTSTAGFGFEFSLLAAMAMDKNGTPGKSQWLGLEPEAKVQYRHSKFGQLNLLFSHVLPGAGLVPKGDTTTPPWRLRANWIARF